MKIVLFDLDETLGYFTQFGIFWDSLNFYFKGTQDLTQDDFNETLDLYPEYLRPHIIPILNYLKHKKMSKCCNKLMIYTNNQGPRKWADQLISYFESKIKFKLFDQIIAAFKVNGKRIEICRTTHDKTYNDLIKCTKIPLNTEICFLDDNFFPEMSNQNVFYINVKPYFHDISFQAMIKKFINSRIGKKLVSESDKNFETDFLKIIKSYKYIVSEKNNNEYEVDKILSKQIMIHLQEFFERTPNQIPGSHKKRSHTRMNREKMNKRNKTLKKY